MERLQVVCSFRNLTLSLHCSLNYNNLLSRERSDEICFESDAIQLVLRFGTPQLFTAKPPAKRLTVSSLDGCWSSRLALR